MSTIDQENTEVVRLVEDTVSKAAADACAVTGSIPVTSATKRGRKPSKTILDDSSASDGLLDDPVIDTTVPEEPKLVRKVIRYKLNYRKNGQIRRDLPKALIYTLSVDWPDLLRVIPADRWVTLDEIARLVSEWENASPRKTVVRKLESIQLGVSELISAGVLLQS